MEYIDTPVSGVLIDYFPAGVGLGDLLEGDLLGGAGLSMHNGELARVHAPNRRGCWLVSVLSGDVADGHLLTDAQVRARGRYFTWVGLGALRPLTRLRLGEEVSKTINPAGYYLTATGALLNPWGGQWRRALPGGALVPCALPVGAELYKIAAVLPR